MTEKVERMARTVLWAVLSIAIVAVPIGMAKNQSAADQARQELKAELKKAEDRIAELSKPKELEAFPFKGLMYLGGLSYGTATGGITFTNTTPKTGILCLKGVVKDSTSGGTTDSIPTCREIKPYDSGVSLDFKFGRADLRAACPQEAGCVFSIAQIATDKP